MTSRLSCARLRALFLPKNMSKPAHWNAKTTPGNMKQASTLHTQTLPHTTQPRNNQVLINLKSAMLGFFNIYAAIFGRRKLIQRGCLSFLWEDRPILHISGVISKITWLKKNKTTSCRAWVEVQKRKSHAFFPSQVFITPGVHHPRSSSPQPSSTRCQEMGWSISSSSSVSERSSRTCGDLQWLCERKSRDRGFYDLITDYSHYSHYI